MAFPLFVSLVLSCHPFGFFKSKRSVGNATDLMFIYGTRWSGSSLLCRMKSSSITRAPRDGATIMMIIFYYLIFIF